jgi:RNA polymerase sigma-70 factor (ECF subfamily)
MHEFTADGIADLMQQHRNELMVFLSQRVKCDEDAQDILQETFIRYAEYSGKNRVDNARAFIYRIAANLATDYMRNHARRSYVDLESEAMADTLADPAPTPEQCVMSQQKLEQLILALSELTPKCRDVFILLRLKNLTYPEVQQTLGISETMLLKYLNRAISHCRQRLEEY